MYDMKLSVTFQVKIRTICWLSTGIGHSASSHEATFASYASASETKVAWQENGRYPNHTLTRRIVNLNMNIIFYCVRRKVTECKCVTYLQSIRKQIEFAILSCTTYVLIFRIKTHGREVWKSN
jgi:hypothetical protein